MVASRTWYVTSFYRFLPIEAAELSGLQAQIKQWMLDRSLLGLVLVATEGVNGTVAGDESAIEDFKRFISGLVQIEDIRFKDSASTVPPFHRVSVDIREEIVGLKRPDFVPKSTEDHHLSPSEWHQAMESDDPKLVIDTRNRYETMAGKFKGAIDPNMKTFAEWGSYLEKADLPAELPIYIYCTGGIRCEKAILEMRSRGFDKVYQLRDGILGYLAEYPDGHYEGDCYVFDDRVAVDKNLLPSGRIGICPGCGLTSSIKKQCVRCQSDYFVCSDCEPAWDPVCSKACKDLYGRHGTKLTSRGGDRRKVSKS
jgi:UPF0176 protein